jgi:two-component system response regulator WspF
MRIGIVNDSPLAIASLRRALALQPALQVVWEAADGEQAVACAAVDTPDLILMDLLMPVMDGVEATRRIMEATPCAIVVATNDLGRNANLVFDAMSHGAIDAVDTPTLAEPEAQLLAGPLLRKIGNIGHLLAARVPRALATHTVARAGEGSRCLVAIGASAGGPAALASLLGALPADFAAAIVAVQHVDAAFAAGMAAWLDGQCRLPVRVAREGDRPEAGVVLLAGSNDHLRFAAPVGPRPRLIYTEQPAEHVYRPSIDVFFDSVVQYWPDTAIGVLLTGMGRDGAQGLKAMRESGCLTIAQDQATSAVYGMPKAAAAIDAASEILPLEHIAPRLVRTCGTRRPG